MARVFLSHSSQDHTFVEALALRLNKAGLDVWYDKWEMRVGDSIVERIEEGISRSDFLVVVLSKHSVASPWVRKELDAATAREIEQRGVFILPVLAEMCDIPPLLSGRRYANFEVSPERAFEELFTAIIFRSPATSDANRFIEVGAYPTTVETKTVARPSSPEVNLIPYKNNKSGKWGFCDENKNIVIPFKYDDIELFKEGIARVRLNQKFGFIDKTGREITPFKYYMADENFRGGVARVNIARDEHKRDLKAGYIDKTGKEIIPVKYDWPPYFYFSEGLVHISFNNKWGFIDDTGRIVVPFQYDSASPFKEGLAAVKLNGKWGFINKKGEVVIQFNFYAASSFSEGLANVQRGTDAGFFRGSIKQWGFIDKNGEEVIPFEYDYQAREYDNQVFSDGLACVQRGGKFGFIDRTGEVVVPFKHYSRVSPFMEGQEVAYVMLEDYYLNKYGFIDKTGYEIVQLKYRETPYGSSSFFQVVGGNVIAGESMFHDGLARVRIDEHQYGFIDKTDYEVIPFKYHEAEPFSEGLACVKNGRYGYIDTTGKEVIPFKYELARSFHEGLARVWLNSHCFYIDKNGTEYYED